jgi:serine/threonine protein kinase
VLKVRAPDGSLRALKVMDIPAPTPGDHVAKRHIPRYEDEIEILRLLSEKAPSAVIAMIDHEILEEAAPNGTVAKKVLVLMELAGPSLHQYLNAHKPSGRITPAAAAALELTELTVRSTFHSLCLAVSKVHDCGVVHFDLKPSNFVLREHHAGPSTTGKLHLAQTFALSDFGIATKMKGASTQENDAAIEETPGTLNYMSPEHFAMTDAAASTSSSSAALFSCPTPSFPSDVWALGCILYQMIYKRTPFGHRSSSVGGPAGAAAAGDERAKILSILYSSSAPPPDPDATFTGDPSPTNPYYVSFPAAGPHTGAPPLATPQAIDLMRRCLENKVERRIKSVREIMNHPYLTLKTNAAPPTPTPAPTKLPAGSHLVTSTQIHDLVALLANSTFSQQKLKQIEAEFLAKLKTEA